MRIPVIAQVFEEQSQGQRTRRDLFVRLERLLKRPIVSYFTSFRFPVMIEDQDADMLEGILREVDLSQGLALLISSPGGDGLAAERITNLCRSMSGTGEYWAIVPGKAKSAATMVCLGASKVLMGPSSELGPIDPQWTVSEEGQVKRFSVCNIVDSYDDLFRRAVEATGNIQPYLQQLSHYDEREIKEFRGAVSLSEDIAAKVLSSGMMKGKTRSDIKKKIEIFLSPKTTKSHGRPIYRTEAAACSLNIDAVDPKTETWRSVYELYIRTNNFVSTKASKAIESRDHAFMARPVGNQ